MEKNIFGYVIKVTISVKGRDIIRWRKKHTACSSDNANDAYLFSKLEDAEKAVKQDRRYYAKHKNEFYSNELDRKYEIIELKAKVL